MPDLRAMDLPVAAVTDAASRGGDLDG